MSRIKKPGFAAMLRGVMRGVQHACHRLVLSNFALINKGAYVRKTTVQERHTVSLITRLTPWERYEI